MRLLIFALFFFVGHLASAAIPEGRWVNDKLVPDDGGYGSYFKAWLIVYDGSIDQIITLGAHYDKKKLTILSDSGDRIEAYDPVDKSNLSMTYKIQNDSLELCMDGGSCMTYLKTSAQLEPGVPPRTHPQTRLSAKWCVDADCEVVDYSDYQSELLYNLALGFNPSRTWNYEGPVNLQKKYGLHLQAMSVAYRLKNDGTQLSSFSAQLFLNADNKVLNEVLAKSGVFVLKEGSLAVLRGRFLGRDIQAEFSLSLRP